MKNLHAEIRALFFQTEKLKLAVAAFEKDCFDKSGCALLDVNRLRQFQKAHSALMQQESAYLRLKAFSRHQTFLNAQFVLVRIEGEWVPVSMLKFVPLNASSILSADKTSFSSESRSFNEFLLELYESPEIGELTKLAIAKVWTAIKFQSCNTKTLLHECLRKAKDARSSVVIS